MVGWRMTVMQAYPIHRNASLQKTSIRRDFCHMARARASYCDDASRGCCCRAVARN